MTKSQWKRIGAAIERNPQASLEKLSRQTSLDFLKIATVLVAAAKRERTEGRIR